MVAASITAKNVTASVGNLVKPITQATTAGAVLGVTILGVLGTAALGIVAAEVGILSPTKNPASFFLNPGSWVASNVLKPETIQKFTNEFDKRMRDYNPPSI
jgi:hypothetical protein